MNLPLETMSLASCRTSSRSREQCFIRGCERRAVCYFCCHMCSGPLRPDGTHGRPRYMVCMLCKLRACQFCGQVARLHEFEMFSELSSTDGGELSGSAASDASQLHIGSNARGALVFAPMSLLAPRYVSHSGQLHHRYDANIVQCYVDLNGFSRFEVALLCGAQSEAERQSNRAERSRSRAATM